MNLIEQWCREEMLHRDSNHGAAARGLCSLLGAHGGAPTLKAILEELLGQINKASHDRAAILMAFDDAAPDAAKAARRESFKRNNSRLER